MTKTERSKWVNPVIARCKHCKKYIGRKEAGNRAISADGAIICLNCKSAENIRLRR